MLCTYRGAPWFVFEANLNQTHAWMGLWSSCIFSSRKTCRISFHRAVGMFGTPCRVVVAIIVLDQKGSRYQVVSVASERTGMRRLDRQRREYRPLRIVLQVCATFGVPLEHACWVRVQTWIVCSRQVSKELSSRKDMPSRKRQAKNGHARQAAVIYTSAFLCIKSQSLYNLLIPQAIKIRMHALLSPFVGFLHMHGTAHVGHS